MPGTCDPVSIGHKYAWGGAGEALSVHAKCIFVRLASILRGFWPFGRDGAPAGKGDRGDGVNPLPLGVV